MQGGFGPPPGGGGGGGGFGAPPGGAPGGGFGAPPGGAPGGGFGAPPGGAPGGGFGAPPGGAPGGGFGAPPGGGFGQQGGAGNGFGPPGPRGPSVGAPPPAAGPPPPGGGGGGEGEPNNIGLILAGVWLFFGFLGCAGTGVAAVAASESTAVSVSYLGLPLFFGGLSAMIVAPFLRTKGAPAAIGAPVGCGCLAFLVSAVSIVVFYTAIWPSL